MPRYDPLPELPSRMLSPREAADRAGLHVTSIRRMIRRGDLPAFKIGDVIRISEDDLIAAMRPVQFAASEARAKRGA